MIETVPAIVIAGSVVALSAGVYIPSASRRLKAYEYHADEFFRAAGKLASSEDTPDWALRLIQAMGNNISRRNVAWKLLRELVFPSGPSSPPNRSHMSELRSKNAGIADLLGTAALHAFLAASYLSPVPGWIVRRLVLFSPADDKGRAEMLAERAIPGSC